MSVRCKFTCTKSEPFGDGFYAEFLAVYSGSPENEKFFKATPNGHLTLNTITEKHFEVGQEYYLDITPVE